VVSVKDRGAGGKGSRNKVKGISKNNKYVKAQIPNQIQNPNKHGGGSRRKEYWARG